MINPNPNSLKDILKFTNQEDIIHPPVTKSEPNITKDIDLSSSFDLQGTIDVPNNVDEVRNIGIKDTLNSSPTIYSPINSPSINSDYSSKGFLSNIKNKNNMHWYKVFGISIMRFVLCIIVGKLAWDCNKNNSIFIRILITLMAVTFSEIYIIYYAIYHTYLGNTCPLI